MSDERDERSALSIGMEWGARITAIGFEFALPALLGLALDGWWNTSPWMTLGGAFLGVFMGMFHVFRLASQLSSTAGLPRAARKPRPPGGHDGSQ